MRMGLLTVFFKYVLKQMWLHFGIIFFSYKESFVKREKVLLKTYLLFFLLISFSLSAQRSAPVAGDAATLTDYLFKNYSAGNPETLMEDIAADRSRVIAIFKTYAIDLMDDKNNKNSGKKNESITTLRLEFLQLQQDYNKQIADNKEPDISKLTNKKAQYYDAVAENDIDQLVLLKKNDSLKKNEFLFSVVEKFEKKYIALRDQQTDVLAQNNYMQSMQKSVPFIGGDLLIDGIDGLSRFLAKRIKEELTLNAVENIQKYLENKEKKDYLYELEAVLPVTVNYLKTFEADQILKFSDDLKQYIEQDLKNILKNAQNLKNTPRVMCAIKNNPDVDFAFEGLEVIDQISKMKSPIDYFSMLENSRNLQRLAKQGGERKKIADALALSTMLAYSLTIIKDGEVRFITTDFVASYGSREDFIKLYFGFLHQQNKKYFNNTLVDLSSIVQTNTNFSKGQNYFRTQITPVAENAERLYSQYLEIKRKNKNNEDVPYKEMYGLVNDVISFAEETVKSGDELLELVPNAGTQNYSQKLISYFKIAHLANNIMLDLDEKRYTNAITKAVEIPSQFIKLSPLTDSENKERNNVIKLIHFINDIAISDSPEAYEKAIESYVLPVGSSSLKEKTKSYYSINSYPGILGGLEKSNGRSAVGFVGLTAPVGLYIQPWSNINNKVTWGFFVPIIDIAAPVRLRLDKDNDTQTLPDFEFADILAPGFYVSVGFKNSPFAFNVGLQYGPKLRNIPVGDSSSFTSVESYRIGLGLTIDIPLVTISSRYEND